MKRTMITMSEASIDDSPPIETGDDWLDQEIRHNWQDVLVATSALIKAALELQRDLLDSKRMRCLPTSPRGFNDLDRGKDITFRLARLATLIELADDRLLAQAARKGQPER